MTFTHRKRKGEIPVTHTVKGREKQKYENKMDVRTKKESKYKHGKPKGHTRESKEDTHIHTHTELA